MKKKVLFTSVAVGLLIGDSSHASNISNNFNPAISLIIDGMFNPLVNNPEAYELPGFALGNEAGLAAKGFAIGHAELMMGANIDDKFYGQFTLALAEHEGATETELEEAFFETIGLGNGFTIKGGRFFSALGYQNQLHNHAWDFADPALIYRGLFGNRYLDDGMRASWIAPTELYIEIGAEAFSGNKFPAGSGHAHGNLGATVSYAKLGGDIGVSHSWQAGLSYFSAHVDERTSGGHGHGDADAEETPSLTGDSNIIGASFIYKWAPNGNYKYRHFKFIAEYFQRTEEGDIDMIGSSPLETTSYDGEQSGFYIQSVYQFMPQWRAGLRYDLLDSNNTGSDDEIIEEAGLHNEGITPNRISAMMEWVPSEFSRIRLQYNHDNSSEETDNQIMLQYTFSLGSHGAHTF